MPTEINEKCCYLQSKDFSWTSHTVKHLKTIISNEIQFLFLSYVDDILVVCRCILVVWRCILVVCRCI